MERRRRTFLALSGVLAAALAGATAAASALVWIPWQRSSVSPELIGDPPALARGKIVRVVTWNIQFSGTRRHKFFYDGGDAVSVDPGEVFANLGRIAQVLRRLSPDIILLQEVDRGSRRTGFIDQHAFLAQALGYPAQASAPYWRARYIPVPDHEPLGAMEMHLSVFSKFKLEGGERIQLPLLDEPWYRQALNLRRALLSLPIPLEGGGELRIFNTHLSAFSHGDGTLGRQVDEVLAELGAQDAQGQRWVLGGDMNALPPWDEPSRLGADAAEYSDPSPPLRGLYERYGHVPGDQAAQADPERWRTYRPFGGAPDRIIDHLFYGAGVEPASAAVVGDVGDTSDHLPVMFEFRVR